MFQPDVSLRFGSFLNLPSPRAARLCLLAAITCGGVIACGDDTEEKESDNAGGFSGTVTPPMTGEEYFVTNCASCHGGQAQGVPSSGPELRHPVPDYFTYVVRNGRGEAQHEDFPGSIMAPYDATQLSDVLLNEMIVYLQSFDKPTDGLALYQDYCGACHGAAGEGPLPIDQAINNETAREFIEKAREGDSPGEFQIRTDFMPSWTAAELSDEELTLMANAIVR